jgi:hypothetical protein
VKMLAQITGTREGVAWPAAGGRVELPDREAAKLCEAGLAMPVRSDEDDVEKRGKAKAKAKAKPAGKRGDK